MQRPSFGEWIVPFVLSGITLVTAWVGHNLEIKLWVAICAYAGLFLLGLGAHLYRLGEYKKWKAKDRVFMKTSEGEALEVPPGGTLSQAQNLGQSCFLRITNLSSKRVKVTNVWLEGCRKDGNDLPVADPTLPKSLDPSDEYHVSFPRSVVSRTDWFDRGRASLTDGSIVKSEKEETPKGAYRLEHLKSTPT